MIALEPWHSIGVVEELISPRNSRRDSDELRTCTSKPDLARHRADNRKSGHAPLPRPWSEPEGERADAARSLLVRLDRDMARPANRQDGTPAGLFRMRRISRRSGESGPVRASGTSSGGGRSGPPQEANRPCGQFGEGTGGVPEDRTGGALPGECHPVRLTAKVPSGLQLPQAAAMVSGILKRGLDWPAPDFSTLSRRRSETGPLRRWGRESPSTDHGPVFVLPGSGPAEPSGSLSGIARNDLPGSEQHRHQAPGRRRVLGQDAWLPPPPAPQGPSGDGHGGGRHPGGGSHVQPRGRQPRFPERLDPMSHGEEIAGGASDTRRCHAAIPARGGAGTFPSTETAHCGRRTVLPPWPAAISCGHPGDSPAFAGLSRCP